jgi:uncharacterized delta-60 repeat protein
MSFRFFTEIKKCEAKFVIVLSFIIGTSPAILCSQPVALDNSFSFDGKVLTDVMGYDDLASSMVIQSDGKIIVAGSSWNGINYDFSLARYNVDGTLDNTFDSDGIVITDFNGDWDGGGLLALQTDGKIILSGTIGSTVLDFAMARYNVDGSLDSTFDFDGKVTTDFGTDFDTGGSVSIQSDGKIVLAGYTWNGVNDDFALARYNSDGSLDTSFSLDGKVTTAIGGMDDRVRSIILQTDGKIIVVGYTQNVSDFDFALARYSGNGDLDSTFDNDGIVTTLIGSDDDVGISVALQIDGKILVIGWSNNGINQDFALVRYNVDGSLDATFDYDGKVTTAIGNYSDVGSAVNILPNGKILAAGSSSNGLNKDFAMVRYLGNGSIDSTFNTNGIITTDIQGYWDAATSLSIQVDGKIILAGLNDSAGYYNFAIARYNLCDTIDESVFQNGSILTAAFSGATYQWIDCDNFNLAIAGETNQMYSALSNGNYAVIINNSGCIDTTLCYNVNSAGLTDEKFANSIHLFPNPATEEITISYYKEFNNATIRLLNVTGMEALAMQNLYGSSIRLQIGDQSSGIYFLEIRDGANVARIKLVKQ